MNKALLTAVVLAALSTNAFAQDSIGYDTTTDALSFGVHGVPVGIWNTVGMSVAGSLATSGGISSGVGVQMSYDPNPCTNAKTGTQRYNASGDDMEYCDGTQWQALTSPFVGDYTYGVWTYTGAYFECEQYNPYMGNCSCPSYAYAVGGLVGQAFRFSPWDETLIHVSCWRQ